MSYANSILRSYGGALAAGSPASTISNQVTYASLAGVVAIGALGAMLGIARHPREKVLMGGVYASGAMVGVPVVMYAAAALASQPTGETT